ncbi:FMN-binding negative transcriptional regulator [Kineosporia rhizophila]|uniref:FMN-binding negative transcriptional regulator n=1 Tax=Kineosporia TaxID=49184 RepID=UPI001E4B48FD|nr:MULTISPECIES: FMN-binding negative transcriptional regulator [Kineosporia]MCE0535297.1 FMN-binding negative transcriptional regulator [Kineosporia rhizophila]GLY16923.1 transcriptional regulator [Kineosporia sp. NBRC 101677]
MRHAPHYAVPEVEEVRRMIAAHPWATLISHTSTGLVVSHYPVLLEGEPSPEHPEHPEHLVLLGHVGRPDEQLHELGRHEVVMVFYGPSGYVSPSWYDLPIGVPTWNFEVVHAYGVPQILSDAENLRELERLVDHFEDPLPNPFRMRATLANEAYAERIVRGTVGFRMRVTRFEAKNKMSQDKPAPVRERIVAALRASGPYHNPELADRVDSSRAGVGRVHEGTG